MNFCWLRYGYLDIAHAFVFMSSNMYNFMF